MSDYYNSLKDENKGRYEEKLNTIGLWLDEDPYLGENGYVADMTSWPPVEYGHIRICLFHCTIGCYTFVQLYNYFTSNYMRLVMSRKIGTRGVMLKAFINPSQKSLTKANQAWCTAKKLPYYSDILFFMSY